MEHQILQPTHNYKEYANSKLQWLPSDTEELFIKNKKERLQELRSNGWLNTEIEYSFNSYGFRSEEFSTSPSILYLGCSFTVGIGLRVEHSWPYLVSTAMNLKCFNLGLGASSNDTAFRMAEYWIKQLKPKIVLLLSPFFLRYETLQQQKDGTLLSIDHSINDKIVKNQMICEENNKGGELILQDPRFNANRGYKEEFNNWFNNETITPKTGQFIIFPSFLYHNVKTFYGKIRLAMPVDLILY
jgi:hypothetical protein